MRFDPAPGAFVGRGVSLADLVPLIDGAEVDHQLQSRSADQLSWTLASGTLTLRIETGPALRLVIVLENVPKNVRPDAFGLRFRSVTGVRSYLRNGYQSWDGSYFVAPGTPAGEGPPAKAPTLGFAMTALLPQSDRGAIVLGFTRHDRYQTRFRFGGTADLMTLDVETLFDRVAHDGCLECEPLLLFGHDEVEPALRLWSEAVAAASPLKPRVPEKRITGWCSWYNLYAAIDEASIAEHLAAARDWRERNNAPLDIFLIDDGFTPEMGDWLEVKPQFPRGMKALIADIESAGFVPGLWIAPFLVGNRSRLFADHPDWVVQDARVGGPLVHARFYGEFRWHKRSEEYYVLDVTHPQAEAYIRSIFRTWHGDWGARYFKADFLLAGAEYGPDVARWHEPGLTRIAIWRRMMALIREEIGDSLLLGCGCPLWASVGLVDAVRIGRDVGVTWTGDYSAESLLRDLQSRNHAHNVLWQADPDCVLLRERFHELSDDEIRSLAVFAGLCGGVLMTSDKLDELSETRSALFAQLLSMPVDRCRFPALGSESEVVLQLAMKDEQTVASNRLNLADRSVSLPDGTPLGAHQSVLAESIPVGWRARQDSNLRPQA